MRTFTLLFMGILLLVSPDMHAQGTPDFTVTNFSMIGKIKYNLGDMMGQPFNAASYSAVRGSAYLTDSFMNAVIVLNNGKAYTYDKVRLNLYTNRVHFLTPDGKEMVATEGVVKKLYFFLTPDSTRPVVYSSGYLPVSGVTPYMFLEEMNQGNYAILKLTSRTIVNDVGTSSTPMGQHFVDQLIYYVVDKKSNALSKWKKGKEALTNILPEQAARIEQYTASAGLSCRSAQEAAQVLQYLSIYQ